MIRALFLGLGLIGTGGLAIAPVMAQQAYGVSAGPAQIDPADCPTTTQDWGARALQRSLTVPLGLPVLDHPTDNPPQRARIELGRKLFFDRRLSINRTMSCAMCHVPEQGFANWEMSTAVGVEGRSVKRNAPTVINVGYMRTLFHDGRDTSLETQFIGPIVALNEMSNPSAGHVVSQLQDLPDYQPLFDAAFQGPASLDRIGMALGAYQRSLSGGNTPFDRWFFGGEEAAVSDDVKQGFALFSGKGNCTACHLVDQESALFTDHQFHDTGYGQMRETMRQNPPKTIPVQVAPGVVHDLDFAKVQAVSAPREADLGRYEVSEKPRDRWRFRTPGLRNVAFTPPYMHDGYFSSLHDVVAFYNQGGAGVPGQDPRVRPLDLNDQEMDQIVAFLNSLTTPNLACLAAEARVQAPDNY